MSNRPRSFIKAGDSWPTVTDIYGTQSNKGYHPNFIIHKVKSARKGALYYFFFLPKIPPRNPVGFFLPPNILLRTLFGTGAKMFCMFVEIPLA